MPQVKLFGNLRDHITEANLDAPGATVADVLAGLCAGNAPLCDAILENGKLRPHVRVMINGRDIDLFQGLETSLSDSDQLAIFPPLAGG